MTLAERSIDSAEHLLSSANPNDKTIIDEIVFAHIGDLFNGYVEDILKQANDALVNNQIPVQEITCVNAKLSGATWTYDGAWELGQKIPPSDDTEGNLPNSTLIYKNRGTTYIDGQQFKVNDNDNQLVQVGGTATYDIVQQKSIKYNTDIDSQEFIDNKDDYFEFIHVAKGRQVKDHAYLNANFTPAVIDDKVVLKFKDDSRLPIISMQPSDNNGQMLIALCNETTDETFGVELDESGVFTYTFDVDEFFPNNIFDNTHKVNVSKIEVGKTIAQQIDEEGDEEGEEEEYYEEDETERNAARDGEPDEDEDGEEEPAVQWRGIPGKYSVEFDFPGWTESDFKQEGKCLKPISCSISNTSPCLDFKSTPNDETKVVDVTKYAFDTTSQDNATYVDVVGVEIHGSTFAPQPSSDDEDGDLDEPTVGVGEDPDDQEATAIDDYGQITIKWRLKNVKSTKGWLMYVEESPSSGYEYLYNGLHLTYDGTTYNVERVLSLFDFRGYPVKVDN